MRALAAFWDTSIQMLEKKYISVDYADKDLAKSLGAKWDPEAKKWYVDKYAELNKIFSWQAPTVVREHREYSEYEIVERYKNIKSRFDSAEEIIHFLGVDTDKLIFVDKGFCPMCDSNIWREWTIDGKVELRHVWDSRSDGLNPKESFILEEYLNATLLKREQSKS
jgi:hypothetical protein